MEFKQLKYVSTLTHMMQLTFYESIVHLYKTCSHRSFLHVRKICIIVVICHESAIFREMTNLTRF